MVLGRSIGARGGRVPKGARRRQLEAPGRSMYYCILRVNSFYPAPSAKPRNMYIYIYIYDETTTTKTTKETMTTPTTTTTTTKTTQSVKLLKNTSPGHNHAAQTGAHLISHRHCRLSRDVSKCVTVVTNELWRQPGRASKCKPNFPQAVLPLKGVLKVCNCRHKRSLAHGKPRKQMQT